MTDISELSDREREILHLVATGASNKEIARDLYISTNTVKVHLRNIFSKIGVTSRTEAAMFAVSAGLVEMVTSSGGDGFTLVPGGESESGNGDLATAFSLSERLPLFVRNPFVIFALAVLIISLGFISFSFFRQGQLPILASSSVPVTNVSSRWNTNASLPQPKERMAAAAYEDKIYILGGRTLEGIVGDIEAYVPEKDEWLSLTPKNVPVSDASAAVIGGKIYIPGGLTQSGNPTDILEVYDPAEDRWVRRAPVPREISGYALVAFEGKMYLFGGWDGHEYVDTVFMYDPGLDEWQTRTPMPTPRAYAGAAVSGGKVFVIGGYDGRTIFSTNEMYLPERDNGMDAPWRESTPAPEARYGLGVTSIADILYAIGGSGKSKNSGDVLEFNPQENEWKILEGIISQTWAFGGLVPFGTRIFALGGSVNRTPSDQNLSYQAIYTIAIPIVR
jgi:DNA-binding CsgD family transcriptional regulator/N-acetylneuraminic acid mutarotase